ncbi:MAG TPA: MFS transporter [Pedococcus sp.]|nr:MFS transporter [Pedococcus sp.]
MTATATPTRAPSLLAREHLPFAVGAVALVTLGAFENRAVLTVLPTVAERLGGLWLFGAASAAPMISFVLATAVAGTWADRRGPLEPMYAGLGLFVLGQLAMGLAPSMPVVVAGRIGGGLAEGLIDIALVVLMARALPEELRAKVFAAFAAAWVLPSVVGPSVAGLVAERLGWRAVFLIAPALVVPAYALLRPAMAQARASLPPPSRWNADERRAVAAAGAVALALAALTVGGSLLTRGGSLALVGVTASLAGVLVLAPATRFVLPPGVLRAARGIPAVIALRGLLSAAFGLVAAYFPLMLTTVHGLRPAAAGISLTVTGLFWAAGSQIHGLGAVQRHVGPARRLRIGFSLIAVGVFGPALMSLEVIPLWAGLALWAVAGLGIGLASPTLSTQMLALSPTTVQGRNTAAGNVTGSVTQAVTLGAAGALIAWQTPSLPGWAFAVIMAGGGVIGLAGAVLAGRAR